MDPLSVLTQEEADLIIADAKAAGTLGDPDCPHSFDRQIVDGQGLVCLDCTIVQVVV